LDEKKIKDIKKKIIIFMTSTKIIDISSQYYEEIIDWMKNRQFKNIEKKKNQYICLVSQS